MNNKQDNPEPQVETEHQEENVEVENVDIENAETEQGPQLTVEELSSQLELAEAKAQENWNKVLRIQAEMENLKKRTQKDLENAHKFGLEKFSKELLTVIDSLELGIQAANSDNPEVVKLREGSELTIKQFEAVFAKFNIAAIDPLGQPFNPELHQAMTMQESAEHEPNSVINVFQKGYALNGRLIRPAMVVVAKAVAEAPKDTPKIAEQA